MLIRNSLLFTAIFACTAIHAAEPAHIDRAIDPCGDFYSYAIGTWQKNNPIPADRARWGAFVEIEEKNRTLLQTIAKEAAAELSQPKSEQRRKVGAMYSAGINVAAIESAGIKPLASDLSVIDAIRSIDDVLTAIAHLQLHRTPMNWRGTQPPAFTFSVRQDQKDSTRYLLQLGQGGLGLPERDYYLNDDEKSKSLRTAYVTFLTQLLVTSGDKLEVAGRDAAAILSLETQLARAHMDVVTRRDPDKTYNKSSQSDFVKAHSGVAWPKYLRALGVAEAEMLNIAQPDYFAALSKSLTDTPIATWKAYLRAHLLSDWADHLPKAFRDARFTFHGGALQGLQAPPPRERVVMEHTDHAIGFALGELFIERAYTAKARERMDAMIVNVKSAMRGSIEALDWMGPETKLEAAKKLDAISWKIGAPKKSRDYAGVNISAENYLASARSAGRYNIGLMLSRLGKPIDRDDWGMTPQTVNAYYNAGMNEIVFPAGILQPPFFDVNGDDAGNYGGIGMVIGHELTHGFDDSGRKFDAVGNLRNWWTKEDEARFLKRVTQIQTQYSNYQPLPGIAINGKLTTGENIADFGGINVAYRAYGLTAEAKAKQSVDGFTPDQRFFIAFAQSWRMNQRVEHLRMQLKTDSHSPARYRVLGPLANFEPFFKAFSCKGDTTFARNGDDVIRIW
jgi:putative endopeptidase